LSRAAEAIFFLANKSICRKTEIWARAEGPDFNQKTVGFSQLTTITS
jgi:hypothetical protein